MIIKILENVSHVMKEIKKVSKSFIPVMSILLLLTVLKTVFELFIIKLVVDYSFMNELRRILQILLIYLFVMGLLIVVNKTVSSVYINKFEVKLKKYFIPQIYKKASEIDIINYNYTDFYNKLNRALEESGSRYFILLMQLFSFFVSILTFVSVFSFYFDPVVICATIINVIVYIVYYFKENKKKYDFEKKEEKFFRYEDYLSRVFSEKEFAQELRLSKEMNERLLYNFSVLTNAYKDRYNEYLKGFVYKSIIMTSTSYLLYWISSIYISSLLWDVKISVGDYFVLINVVSVMSTQLINILKVLPDIYESSAYIDEINEIINYSSDFKDDKDGIIAGKFNNITFNNVCFGYNHNERLVLDNISFKINKNETIAIVGLNGAGKTTIIDCILGLLKPNSGTIELNGIDYNKYNINTLRNIFSVVFQDYQIYEASIAVNILMREINTEQDIVIVKGALKYVELLEKVNNLEEGINTIISDNVQFSGGEIQKLIIARAYANSSSILIFDEPTSALDVFATNSFYSSMFGLRETQDKTIIFTSHKLQYVVDVDKIIFVDNGKVCEVGSHDELLAINKGYAALYKFQTKELFEKE